MTRDEIKSVLDQADKGHLSIEVEPGCDWTDGWPLVIFKLGNGWRVEVFNDCNEWDYVEAVTNAKGEQVEAKEFSTDAWESWKPNHPERWGTECPCAS